MVDDARGSPRISVNKLAEYMTAHAGRRRQIIAEQKRPRDVIVARYTDAREAITRHLLGGGVDDAAVLATIEDLQARQGTTDWQQQDLLLSAEALENYLEIDLDLADELEFIRTPDVSAVLTVAGVEVSVRPEVVLRGTSPRGQRFVGAVKAYIGKTHTLDGEGGIYGATILHQWVDEVMAAEGRGASVPHCIVCDVFGRKRFVAPRSFVRRRRHVRDACEEIALRWNMV